VLFCDAQTIALNQVRRLHLPLLSIARDERVVITGDNGSGKSTLLRHLLGQIKVPKEKLIYLPQELSADAGTEVLDQVRELPNEQLGHVMNVVRRLGSDPGRLLDSQQPSPGEMRKLLLALGTTSEPHLLILDEPTNHLDLPSLNALESALGDCPCALIVVSHDQRFLDQLGGTAWHLDSDSAGNSSLLLN
jgi:ATPase subunit of ABC transporter with duplicated ATPase domains